MIKRLNASILISIIFSLEERIDQQLHFNRMRSDQAYSNTTVYNFWQSFAIVSVSSNVPEGGSSKPALETYLVGPLAQRVHHSPAIESDNGELGGHRIRVESQESARN